MFSKKKTKILVAGVAGLSTILASVLIQNTFVQAQNTSTNSHRVQKRILPLAPATLRTAEARKLDMQRSNVGNKSASYVRPFRPRMPLAQYLKLKKAASHVQNRAPKPSLASRSQPKTTTIGINCSGDSRTLYFPPDTHGAVGETKFVEVTNDHFSVYNKSGCGSPTYSVNMNTFFGVPNVDLTDPRVLYDSTWKRWVITMFSFTTDPIPKETQYIAISTTSDPAGSYYIYGFNANFSNNGNFWDYDELGMNQDAIFITAYIFDTNNNATSDVLSIAKARLYNGLGWGVPVFTGLEAGVAPPIVIDQNPCAFFVAAPDNSSTLKLYKLCNGANAFDATLSGPTNVSVPAYKLPPLASQGSTDPRNLLDTLDNRFVNASTQIGKSLWQVHTVALDRWPAPKFYEIDTSTNTVKQNGFFYASSTSYDWNASIVANSANQAFVTWSSSDPENSDLAQRATAQVRASSCSNTTPNSCSFGRGVALATSFTILTGNYDPNFGFQRWGDYSAVTIDPSDSSGQTAWLVNEKIDSSNTWGSQFGNIKGF